MRDLFEMYKSEMRCHLVVAILDNSKIAEVVLTDELKPLCVIPPDEFELANQLERLHPKWQIHKGLQLRR